MYDHPSATRAFWCEQTTYDSLHGDDISQISRHSATNPAEAIRHIRVTVRSLASALPPIERHRALSWIDDGGCLGAIAALHRNEPCGFSLSYQEQWIEWTVHPYLRFDVAEELRLRLVPLSPSLACR
ncbi:hypothetical protein [Streptomyces sp. NPDC006638]|uniref:hypothetical protein n=1 Tax=Streptomyces sp. NPDC006638 TaxID=3157183 RepID=UPI0033AD4711